MESCSICKNEFVNEQGYLKHICITGFNPTQPEHFGESFILQSKAALERTGSLTEEKKTELDLALENVRAKNVDDVIMREKVKHNEI